MGCRNSVHTAYANFMILLAGGKVKKSDELGLGGVASAFENARESLLILDNPSEAFSKIRQSRLLIVLTTESVLFFPQSQADFR